MDPSWIGEITSAGSLAVSTINLIISRLDKRRDVLEHPDSATALFDLEKLLVTWVDESLRTNNIVQAHIKGKANRAAVHASFVHQYVTMSKIEQIGITGGPIIDRDALHKRQRQEEERRRSNLAQFLRIYAPEFSDEFQAAAQRRYDLLREIQAEGSLESKRDARKLSKALTRSRLDLVKSLDKLHQFIQDKIKP
jgi:hypothetical protein